MAEILRIDHVGQRGDGVSFAGGQNLFVPYTLPGETVEAGPVAGHPDRRHLIRIEHPSPQRIAPFCRYFGACGGCAIQHWQAEAYHAWKRAIVVETLDHAGIACEVAPLVDAHGAGRRRITLHARRGDDGVLRTGFAEAASHAIVAIEDCPILDPGLRGALDAALMAADIVIKPKFEIDLLSSIVQFVEQGNIATILPRVVVQRKVDEGVLRAHTIASPPIVRHIIQVTHPKRPIGPAAQALIAIITDEIKRVTTGVSAGEQAP